MAFEEDLSPFFNTAEFADAATVGGVAVDGIFDNGYQAALGGLMESTGPTFTAATADLSSAVDGTTVAIGGVHYKVMNNQPDGTGVTVLSLEKAAA